MNKPLHILMVAAENDALPGGKVGGIGDVVRDVPPALARRDCEVTVVTPAYGAFANLPGTHRRAAMEVGFAGIGFHVDFYEAPAKQPIEGVRHWVADHPEFSTCGPGRIYCDDPPGAPFASDARKFALFCTAVAEALVDGVFGRVDVLHLHDWHAAFVLLLARFHPAYRRLQGLRTVYSIHNLALQGIRPFHGHESSLAAWFPNLIYDHSTLRDPRWPDCLNPMGVGIRLADAVHTVSPTYAEEILAPSAVETRGYYGGEGLESDLVNARNQDRLQGIINGCEYPPDLPTAPDWPELRQRFLDQVLRWAGASPVLSSAQFLAYSRLERLTDTPGVILTSVSRITEQKMRLLRQADHNGRPALEGVLETLGDRGVYLFLGSGDEDYEAYLTATASRWPNFIFLRGYSDPVAQMLYAVGDLFLMPSSFEPCGISQMLAMRAGQPCLVHHVGGLKDTVWHGVNGFAFTGDSLPEQAGRLVETTRTALEVREREPERWAKIRDAARAARFSWDDSVTQYLDRLYLAGQ